jgi:hypothetical protein
MYFFEDGQPSAVTPPIKPPSGIPGLNVAELSFSSLKTQQDMDDIRDKITKEISPRGTLLIADQSVPPKKSIFLDEHHPIVHNDVITALPAEDSHQNKQPRAFTNVNEDLQHVHKQMQIEILKQLLKLKNISFDWFDILIKLVWQSVHLIRPDVKHDNDSMDIRTYIKIKKLPGVGLTKADCRIVNGLVFGKNVAHKNMQRDIKTPKILLLRASIEYQRTEEKMCSLEPILAAESQYLRNYCSKLLLRHNPDILVVEKSVARFDFYN